MAKAEGPTGDPEGEEVDDAGEDAAGARPPPPLAARDRETATRAAWLYYVEGLTQAQIARRLGLNRIRVNRILAQARESGIVQIRVHGKLADCARLEAALVDRWGLANAVVVPTPEDESIVPQAIALEAGYVLSRRLEPGIAVGIGWGRTLRLSLASIEERPLPSVEVVSLIGGLTRGSVLNAYETAFHLADRLGGSCYYIAGPVYADTRETRDVLMAQGLVREAIDRARTVDTALVSVGAVSEDATMRRLGLISAEEARELREAGAVGDLCGHWIDEHGRVVDHPLNERVIALPPEDLLAIPDLVLASGGRAKIAVIRGALSRRRVKVFVTDTLTAQMLLGETPS